MRCIYVDRMDDGRISVRIAFGFSKPKARYFTDRNEAIHFAESKMGRRGMVVDTTLMTPKQLAAHKEREARAAALLEEMQEKGE